ncbi:hypothetical protein ACLEPN_10670 [Myxococcus sp. 1LA]
MSTLKKSLLAVIAAIAIAPAAAISDPAVEARVCIDKSPSVEQSAPTSINCRAIRDQYLCTFKGCSWDDEAGICY